MTHFGMTPMQQRMVKDLSKVRCFLALLCALTLVFSLCTPALAVEKQEIVDLGDGFYAVITLDQVPMSRAGDVVKGSKTGKVYNGTTQIGTMTLGAEFDISGATARATSSVVTGSGMNGWSYDRGTTSRSGNKVTGTGYFSSGSTVKAFSLTLTCSPDGEIS